MPAGHPGFPAGGGAEVAAALGAAEATGAAVGGAATAEVGVGVTVAGGAAGIGVLTCSGFPEQARRAKAEATRRKGRIAKESTGIRGPREEAGAREELS